jgi:hypothetical protein
LAIHILFTAIKYIYKPYYTGTDMNETNDISSANKFDLLGFSQTIKYYILSVYILLFAFTVLFGLFIIAYVLLIFVFLLLASSMGGFNFVDKIMTLKWWQQVLLIFGVAYLLRALLLYQQQIITWDIDTYVWRSENMLKGQVPYRDFYGGNKPPLYQFMLFSMGYLFTPGMAQFRAVFAYFDALIPLMLLLICTERYNERTGIIAALIYTIFPIGIIGTGLEGHFDSIVALSTLISIYLLFKKNIPSSGLFLGIGFALKIYPAVLLPFFLTTIKSWKKRIVYTIFFALPTIIADGALFMISRAAFYEYLDEEARWEGTSAFSSIIETMANTTTFLSVKISWIVLGFFGILILLMLVDWISPKRNQKILKWFKIIIIVYIFYYGFYIIYGVLYYDNPLSMALIPLAIYIPSVIFFIIKILPKLVPDSLANPEKESLIIVSAFAIILFMMGLPNIAPWYFIWFFPFFLAIDTDKIRYTLMWLFAWHGIGKEMKLFPGSQRIN